MQLLQRLFILLFFIFFLCVNSAIAKKGNPDLIKSSFEVTVNDVKIKVEFLSNEIVRIYKTSSQNKCVKESLIVSKNKNSILKIIKQESDNNIVLNSSSIKVIIDKKTGAVSFYNNQNKQLLSEDVTKSMFQKIDDSITHVSQTFILTPDEGIYGLGQHQTGNMNQRNQTILLRQKNMDIAIPFLQSTQGYGIYWDNYSSTIYSDTLNKMNLKSQYGNCVDYYFIEGKNADEIISGYRELTGKVPMFPLWVFGYIQSRERYQSQQQVLNVVKKYRALKVPLDMVVQDWQYWGVDQNNWNSVEFNNPNYANPKAMIDSIHLLNAKIMISVWPSFGSKSAIYQELLSKKMLYDFPTYPIMNNVKVYDAFNSQARDTYWNYMNKNLLSKGIDGWWLDATEPEQKYIYNKDEADNSIKNKADTFHAEVTQNAISALGTYNRFANAYPFETVNGVYTHHRQTISNKRAFILTRSAFAGQQRAASMVWSGDITSSWQTLKKQIPAALNYSLSGMPYWNSDIGGFYSGTYYPKGNKDILFQELYIRWIQFATFTAMMRSHGTNTAREIYQFGKPGDIAFNAIRKYIELRYRLEPYIYSSAWNITSDNASLMRALIMDYPNDKNVYNLGNEYLFGNYILTAPVTDSIFARGVEKLDTISTVSTEIYLPKGTWYNFNTNEKIEGGKTIKQVSNIMQMPVFVKGGSIIPLAKEAQYSSIKNFRELQINIYPGKNSEFSLYEDEGDNYNYEKGKYSIIKFVWNDISKTLTIEKRKGEFSGMQVNRVFDVHLISSNVNRIVQYRNESVTVKFSISKM